MITLISTATTEPITLAQAKQHLKMDGIDDDDDLITALIASAREIAERITGRDLVRRQWAYKINEFPAQGALLPLPKAPLASVESVTYIDTSGAEQTLSADVYGVNADRTGPYLYLKYNQQWPAVRLQWVAVTVSFTSGYPYNADASPVDELENMPPGITAAIKVILRDLYDNRGSADKPSAGAEGSTAYNLLATYRRMGC